MVKKNNSKKYNKGGNSFKYWLDDNNSKVITPAMTGSEVIAAVYEAPDPSQYDD